MSRLYDRALRKGIEHPSGRKYYDLGDPIVIDTQNVFEYCWKYKDESLDWSPRNDFPTVAPPFTAYWMEHQVREYGYTVGVLFNSADLYAIPPSKEYARYLCEWFDLLYSAKGPPLIDGSRVPFSRLDGHLIPIPQFPDDPDERRWAVWAHIAGLSGSRPAGETSDGASDEHRLLARAAALLEKAPVRWMTLASVFIEHRGGRVIGPIMTYKLPITQDGQWFLPPSGIFGIGARIPRGPVYDTLMEEMVDGVPVVARAIMGAALFPTLLAVSFMHCKNVELVEHAPAAPLSKKHNKKYGRPLVRYHTLNIEPMKKVLRHEGQAEKMGLKKALHICRGHFKDYRESGLFGKVKGIFWWDSHVRGSPSEGIVVKDYAVKEPQS